MVERFSMNPVSCKLLNEAWKKEFPDEVAIAERMLALLDENIQLQRGKDALEAVALALRDDMRDARGKLEAAERRIAEHRKVLNSLAAVARRYLPDYDEHPEIQAADELLESAAGIKVKGE
ncbi:ead/Ea22-like family protein [Salmonella enterica]|nr:ead/Ea22-like family protein [Salmonella enterica]